MLRIGVLPFGTKKSNIAGVTVDPEHIKESK